MTPRPGSAIDAAATRLRAEILAREDGAFLGNDEALQKMLGVSRPTMRQAALLIEREGLLRVRRGANGGYFGIRPAPHFIEEAVSTYLETLSADVEDLTAIATLLWVEAVRKAASLGPEATAEAVLRLNKRLRKLSEDADFDALYAAEVDMQRIVFDLINSPYVELIFNVNANFARRRYTDRQSVRDESAEPAAYIRDWRRAKAMEIAAIADGDTEVAMIAARRGREIFLKRIRL